MLAISPGLLPASMAGRRTSERHPVRLGLCDVTQPVALDSQRALDGDRPEAMLELELDERHDRRWSTYAASTPERSATCALEYSTML